MSWLIIFIHAKMKNNLPNTVESEEITNNVILFSLYNMFEGQWNRVQKLDFSSRLELGVYGG